MFGAIITKTNFRFLFCQDYNGEVAIARTKKLSQQLSESGNQGCICACALSWQSPSSSTKYLLTAKGLTVYQELKIRK